MIIDIDTSKPILRIAKYVDEAEAYGLPYHTFPEQADIIIKMIGDNRLKEPLYIDGTGVAGAVVDLLRAKGVKVVEFKTQMLRGGLND
jgi:hypothetical protein